MSTLRQLAFTAGELAPSLYARVDMAKYQTGLRTMRNFLTLRSGGAANRPGTHMVAEVSNSGPVKLLKFVFNSEQAYVLEFGDHYMRVIRNGAYVIGGQKAITGVSLGATITVTSPAHGFSNGDEVYIDGVGGTTQLNGRTFVADGVTTNTFVLLDRYALTYVNGTGWGAYTSGGSASLPDHVFELITPYNQDDLADLQGYAQAADTMVLTHHNHEPARLTRLAHSSWTLTDITFAPSISPPTTGLTQSGAAGSNVTWLITSIAAGTFEESGPSAHIGGNTAPTLGAGITVGWTPVAGAIEYNIYRAQNGIFGYVGTAAGGSFLDLGAAPDTTDTPPALRNPFSGSGNWPSTAAYVQQRLLFANAVNAPETVWSSRTANYYNYTVSNPLQSDDAITFTLAGRQVNPVEHILDLGKLVLFTGGGVWTAEGGEGGVLSPTDINLKQHSYVGSSKLPPLPIDNNALYVQARGAVIRDLGFDYQADGYRGNDLTVFSSHLVDGYQITDWTYQETPHSTVWAVRDDGVLLGLTYIREHEIRAWHRHDFSGEVEAVCAIPEGTEDALYLVVNRTDGPAPIRYIERMASRDIDDIRDAMFMDCALTYDGRNEVEGHTMQLAGGTLWDETETLSLVSIESTWRGLPTFSSADIGNVIVLRDGESVLRFTVSGVTNSFIVTGTIDGQAQPSQVFSVWEKAVDQVLGLSHLEGKEVSVIADGHVLSSPNNTADESTPLVVTDGELSFDEFYSVIHVGLPITADLETLDIDMAEGETMIDKQKRVSAVTLFVERSKGGFVGARPPSDDETDPLEYLEELRPQEVTDPEATPELITDKVEASIPAEWNSHGRVFIRQVDPLPLTVLAIAPAGDFITSNRRRG